MYLIVLVPTKEKTFLCLISLLILGLDNFLLTESSNTAPNPLPPKLIDL